MRDELQELVDRVSALLGAPATLEDAEFTLLAFCAHPVEGEETPVMDAVRTRSILARGSTPDTRRRFEDFGIATAEGPLRTPGDPAAGILTRLVLPVRHGGRTRGYLWLLDGGRTDPAAADDPALAGAVELAAEAGRLLAEREEDAGDLGRPLATALTGPPAAAGPATATLTAAWGASTAVVVVALRPAGAGLPSPWRAPAAGAVTAVLPGEDAVAVAVPLPGTADLRPAVAVTAAALAGLPPGSSAGLSAVGTAADGLPGRWAQARTAARVAAAVPRFSPVAHWDELGGWRIAAALPGPDPAVRPLLASPLLTTTAETWLDAGCSVARASAALHVHRQTLYARLARIGELTGLDVADGDARLLLHASLRNARLTSG